MTKLADALEGGHSGWRGVPYLRIDGDTDSCERLEVLAERWPGMPACSSRQIASPQRLSFACQYLLSCSDADQKPRCCSQLWTCIACISPSPAGDHTDNLAIAGCATESVECETMSPVALPQIVRRFATDPRIKVALLSVTAAGTGLDFSAASHVVFAELPHEVQTRRP